MIKVRFRKLSSCFAVLLILSACQESNDEPVVTNDIESKKVHFQNEVALVKVNGESITEQDLDAAIVRTVGEFGAFQLDDGGRKKVLESIVLSKIMAQKQISSYSQEQKIELERQVQAYRTELLAKNYLKENVTAVPVSNKMVADYYNQHPEKFGGKVIKQYQVLKGLTKLEGSVRKKLLSELGRISNTTDWPSEVEKAKKNGVQLTFSTGLAGGTTLDKNVEKLVASLSVDEVSELYYFDGFPMYFKVISIKKIKPKPLGEVSKGIRKSLAPLQLKKAVRKISEELLKSAEVKYQTSESVQ